MPVFTACGEHARLDVLNDSMQARDLFLRRGVVVLRLGGVRVKLWFRHDDWKFVVVADDR